MGVAGAPGDLRAVARIEAHRERASCNRPRAAHTTEGADRGRRLSRSAPTRLAPRRGYDRTPQSCRVGGATMKGYHAATGAPRRRHGRPRLTDVYRSDFLQDSGTPLQWLCAWEVVETRERAEALARLAVVLTITSSSRSSRRRCRRSATRVGGASSVAQEQSGRTRARSWRPGYRPGPVPGPGARP
jgi:hypothetical protein